MDSTTNPDLPTLSKRSVILDEEHFHTFHLQYREHSGTFANSKYEELSYHKTHKLCDPLLVSLLKMQLHYSQTTRTGSLSFFKADLSCVNAVRWVKERKGGSYERYHGHQKVEKTHHGDWN